MKRTSVILVLIVFSAIAYYWLEIRSFGPPQKPLYEVTVSLQSSQEEALHSLMHEFAEENGFRIRVEQTSPNRQSYMMTLRRSDLWLTLSTSGSGGWDYVGGFYRTYRPPPAIEDIVELGDQLRAFGEDQQIYFEFSEPEAAR